MKRWLPVCMPVFTALIIVQPAPAQVTKTSKPVTKTSKPVTKTSKPAKKPPHRIEFERLDSDRNAKLDAKEFLGGSVGKAGDEKRRQHAKFDRSGDGVLDTEEFWRFTNRPPEEDWLRGDFKQRDKDKDGTLTPKEYLGDKTGALKTEARTKFYRYDTDENQELTLPEFLDRDANRKVSIHNQFLIHDLNDDRQLTEQEFMRTRVGKDYEQMARDNFTKLDANGDHRLSEQEFMLLPGNVAQQVVIEREQRWRTRYHLAWRMTIALSALLCLLFAGWRYSRYVARR